MSTKKCLRELKKLQSKVPLSYKESRMLDELMEVVYEIYMENCEFKGCKMSTKKCLIELKKLQSKVPLSCKESRMLDELMEVVYEIYMENCEFKGLEPFELYRLYNRTRILK